MISHNQAVMLVNIMLEDIKTKLALELLSGQPIDVYNKEHLIKSFMPKMFSELAKVLDEPVTEKK